VEKEIEESEKTGFFSRLKKGLFKTRDTLAGGIDNVVHGKAKLGPELLNDRIIEALKREVQESRIRTHEEVVERLKKMMEEILKDVNGGFDVSIQAPFVILVIGVNGSGKTTTIGKLAQRWKEERKKVMVAAGDTFRAAAIDQLQVWADRTGVPCIRQKSGADPSAVAFDAVQAAVARKMDIVIIDTAGRLQTNRNLMEELKKVKRVIDKVLPGAPHETLLVLDSSLGQNSVSQARLFHEALEVDGLVMTKLDGTGKGGVLLGITHEMKLPVRFIGVGEKAEDLQPFDAGLFVRALFEK